MKVLQFTIPVAHNKSIITQAESQPYFYPHLHRHNEIQITWVRKGEGTLIAENNMHTFQPDDIFLLGPNQPHLFKSEPGYFLPKSKKLISALTIFFDPAGQLAAFLDIPEVKSIKAFLQQYQSGFKVPAKDTAEVSNKMLLVMQHTGIDQLSSFLDLLKKLNSLQGITPLSSYTRDSPYSEHEGIRIGHIYNYIMQHYNKSITLEDVAKQAHMTPQAFCRYFKKHTRHTFVSFLNEVRINEACKRLTDGAYDSIATVAYNCGFNSITNFNRVFKTITGNSPSEYTDNYFVHVDR
ncbi:AraC family transcriptional regulator [Chitinophagaceae bacterium LWZ2-11]